MIWLIDIAVILKMNRFIELPITEPIYKTYHYQGPATAIIIDNPSIRNWYLNQVMNLTCSRRFLHGYTSPELTIPDSSWKDNPYLEKVYYPMRYAKGYINPIIRELLNHGYYVTFGEVDDYYIKGKSWYKERHFPHDGLICGYNQDEKTYCIYAHDCKWVYQKFWTQQNGFNDGRKYMLQKEIYGDVCGLKPKPEHVELSPETVYKKLQEYLDSTYEKYPKEEEGNVYGIIVQDYIAEYIGKLIDGSIPYECMDRRIFRVIWEHKKAMLERIIMLEKVLGMEQTYSEKYCPLVALSDSMRMSYASHHMKRRDSILPIIRKKLLTLMESEREILTKFTDLLGKEYGG